MTVDARRRNLTDSLAVYVYLAVLGIAGNVILGFSPPSVGATIAAVVIFWAVTLFTEMRSPAASERVPMSRRRRALGVLLATPIGLAFPLACDAIGLTPWFIVGQMTGSALAAGTALALLTRTEGLRG